MNKIEIRESFKKRETQKNDLKGMQFVALEILKEFDKICRRNGIEYWLTDGTLLGAVRHKGFIPWDDDIDVCVKNDDMEKLKECLEKELPYHLNIYRFEKDVDIFYKIFDKYSKISYQNEDGLGIWIDIFPMSYVKKDEKINKIIKNSPKKRNIPKEKKWLNFREKFTWSILNLFNIKSREENIEKYYEIISQKEQDSYLYMKGKMWWHMYKKDLIFPLKEIEFEGYKFLCPNNFHQYLTSYYGDYMKLPPLEKRIPLHSEKVNIFNEIEDENFLNWNNRKEHIEKFLK
ncbi:MAG: LicD family protein [Fusobacterium sp.]|uniref:LicD family protein n=1 Tax=Fusobacterium sp. TaxID=68766 RepID=UPI002A7629E8|nr:LicD family protein [Fusobacterium sp.]MDY2981711.1 LicD family protein [Fusobacterium sp.]